MKKVLIVIGCIALLGGGIVLYTSLASQKMVCKSSQGNITIMYNDKTITGYAQKGIEYDLDGQRKIAENIGVEEYLKQFDAWFRQNTDGSCEK